MFYALRDSPLATERVVVCYLSGADLEGVSPVCTPSYFLHATPLIFAETGCLTVWAPRHRSMLFFIKNVCAPLIENSLICLCLWHTSKLYPSSYVVYRLHTNCCAGQWRLQKLWDHNWSSFNSWIIHHKATEGHFAQQYPLRCAKCPGQVFTWLSPGHRVCSHHNNTHSELIVCQLIYHWLSLYNTAWDECDMSTGQDRWHASWKRGKVMDSVTFWSHIFTSRQMARSTGSKGAQH